MNEGSLLDSAEVYSRCTEEASRCSHCNTRLFAEIQKRRFVSLYCYAAFTYARFCSDIIFGSF